MGISKYVGLRVDSQRTTPGTGYIVDSDEACHTLIVRWESGSVGEHHLATVLPMIAVKLRLFHVRLDRGGYDAAGTYYGAGEPLYEYHDDTMAICDRTRAKDRAEAKRLALAEWPNATFYR